MPSAQSPEDVYRVFGNRLRQLREAKHMRQEELATMSSLSRSSIANIENGKQRVLLHHLLHFANALDIQLNSLLSNNLQDMVLDSKESSNKTHYLDALRSALKNEDEA